MVHMIWCGGLDGTWDYRCLGGYGGHWVRIDILVGDGDTPVDGGI